jgi:hypothetical protein
MSTFHTNPYLQLAQDVPESYIREIDEDRALLERALALEASYSFEDVKQGVEHGLFQYWPLPHSVVITQLIQFPQKTVFFIFLAAGEMREIEAASAEILAWGKEKGATEARITGRPGWARSYLVKKDGWAVAPFIQLTKDL